MGESPPPPDPDHPPLGFFFDLRSLNLTLDFVVALFFGEAMLFWDCGVLVGHLFSIRDRSIAEPPRRKTPLARFFDFSPAGGQFFYANDL
jgi:hypothetical protein